MMPALSVRGLQKHFTSKGGGGVVQAVNDVSFDIPRQTTLGLVGESGAGKSTVGRCILRLTPPTAGTVLLGDTDVGALNRGQLRQARARMQMVFQDPYDSLNPRMRIRELVDEPLLLNTSLGADERYRRVLELLDLVRLEERHLDRFPHQLSGGQLQRVGIARAIATNPEFIVLDEPTSSLDLSVQAGILSLLKQLQSELGLTYLLISHDLRTVEAYCDRVAVMYLGSIVESGTADDVFNNPQHPYTQALASAALPADHRADISRHMLTGELPSPVNLPDGCLFASRCPLVIQACRERRPSMREVGPVHGAACIRIDDGSNLLPDPRLGGGDV